MKREPDWETLSEINFLLHNRTTEQLNAALHALENLPESDNQRARTAAAIYSALNMHNAWANLIRYKTGTAPNVPGDSSFKLADLLDWICAILQISDLPHRDDTIILEGNQETLQEALMLMHSCAQTLGPGARVVVDEHPRGFWFRVRYGATSHCPTTLGELLGSLQANWRLQSAAFELRSAGDFLAMNNYEMYYTPGDHLAELAFFVRAARPTAEHKDTDTKKQARALLDTYNADETHRVITDLTD